MMFVLKWRFEELADRYEGAVECSTMRLNEIHSLRQDLDTARGETYKAYLRRDNAEADLEKAFESKEEMRQEHLTAIRELSAELEKAQKEVVARRRINEEHISQIEQLRQELKGSEQTIRDRDGQIVHLENRLEMLQCDLKDICRKLNALTSAIRFEPDSRSTDSTEPTADEVTFTLPALKTGTRAGFVRASDGKIVFAVSEEPSTDSTEPTTEEVNNG